MMEGSKESPASEHLGNVSLWTWPFGLVHGHRKPSQEQRKPKQESTLPPAKYPSAAQALGSPVAGPGLHFLTGFSDSTKRQSVEVDPTVQLAPIKQKNHTGHSADG